MSNEAENPATGPSLEGSPTARAVQQESGSMDPNEQLAKFQFLGEDHIDYKNLKEAIARRQPDQIQQAMAKLAGYDKNGKTEVGAPPEPSSRFPLWSLIWVILVSVGLSSSIIYYVNAHLKEILAKQPKPLESIYYGSELLGGKSSQDFSYDIVQGIADIKPDNIIFVGHQLAKKEVVEYLSAISKRTRIKVLIGTDATGYNPLDNPQSLLKQYLHYTELREAKYPIRSQVLIVVNTSTQRGMALFGTYPFDVNDASKGEHFTVCIRNYSDCVQLYDTFNKLFPGR
jgi:hypothetical protein